MNLAGAAAGVVAAALLAAPASVSLEGIAAIISASAGVITALTAAVLAVRSRKSVDMDGRVEVLMELLKEELADKRETRDSRGWRAS